LTGDPDDVRLIDGLALVLWVGAFFGESISDHQLSVFRLDPANKAKVCDLGFWKYSRHPNYFFEWLLWIVWLMMAFGSSTWWISAAAAITMLILMTKITGIPFVEDQSIRSRGDAYIQYQKRTSPFIPWFPKLDS
jgi:steroid 5-alpha reductase family enzyme